jgi:hypothetical protein
VRDALYSAGSVDEALRLASLGLGVTVAELRYVVLDAGSDQRPARIAVLLEAMQPAARRVPREPPPRDPVDTASRPARIREWFAALSEVLAPLEVEVEDAGSAGVRVRLQPGDPGLLESEEWEALELLLRRAFGSPRLPGRVLFDVPGRRVDREAGLRRRAQELAAAVRSDGEPRSTEPLNSYERRLVHVAVAELGGLTTESQGEGAVRTVAIRLAEAAAEP